MAPSQHPLMAVTAPPLPSGFVTAQDVLDGKAQVNSRVNIVGIITDYRAPIQTRGIDYKCQIRFFDLSIEDDEDSVLSVNIFRPQKEMPIASCGDVILLQSVKIQRYQMEAPSLITHKETRVHIYLASKIPKYPGNALGALRPSPRTQDRNPAQKENAYIAYMFHKAGKGRVPTETEFELMTFRSSNVKDKFGLLQDVQEGCFYDIVAQVVKEPYDQGDKTMIWVSDYTENKAFFHHAFNSQNLEERPVGDPFGYTTGSWKGPFGKRSLQITCFEPHASAIRQGRISSGTWVSIRNLQVKYGHNITNLEGYLREDRAAHGPKLGISALDPRDNAENINPKLKDAVRRKRDYERSKKNQLQEISEAAQAGQKRKAEISVSSEPKKAKNSKARRKALRAQAQEDEQATNEPVVVKDLNSQVKCENQNKMASRVADLLEPVLHKTTINGKPVELKLPFVNANYRTNVRVVSFMPAKLEDFAFAKKVTEFDILSDDGDSDDGSQSEHASVIDSTTDRIWEWRFHLELEDAAVLKTQQKRRMWVVVDNQAAQCLLNLDASDLRQDETNLETLRQRLFLLWGDLEEHKARAKAQHNRKLEAVREGKPPTDSSDDDEPSHRAAEKTQVVNLPFTCCIRQYGVKVREQNAALADAGEGSRWQRMFSMFGTRMR